MADSLTGQEAGLTDKFYGLDMSKVDNMLKQTPEKTGVDKSIDFLSSLMVPDRDVPKMQLIPSQMPDLNQDIQKQNQTFDKAQNIIQSALSKSEKDQESSLTPEQQKSLAAGVTAKGYTNALNALNASTKAVDMMQASQLKSGELENRLKELPDKYKILSRNDVLNSMSSGQKVLTAVAAGLGAFGAALTHSPNFAQNMIDENINSEVNKSKEQYAQALEEIKNESSLNLTKLDMAVKKFSMANDLTQKSLNAGGALAQVAAERSSSMNNKLKAFELKTNIDMNNAKINFANQTATYQAKEAARIGQLNSLNDPTYSFFDTVGPNGPERKLTKFRTKEAADKFSVLKNTVMNGRQVLSDVRTLLEKGDTRAAEEAVKNFDATNGTKLSEQLNIPVLRSILPLSPNDFAWNVRERLNIVTGQLNDSLDNFAKAYSDPSATAQMIQPLMENVRGINNTKK